MSNIIPITQAKRSGGQGNHFLAAGGINKTGQVIRIPIYENEKLVTEAASELSPEKKWFVRDYDLSKILDKQRKPLKAMGLSYEEIETEFEEFKRRVHQKLLKSDLIDFNSLREQFHVYGSERKVMIVEGRYNKENEINLYKIDIAFDPRYPDFLGLAGIFSRICAVTFGMDAVELRGYSDATKPNDFFLRYVECPDDWLEAKRTWGGWMPKVKKITVNRMNKLVGY